MAMSHPRPEPRPTSRYFGLPTTDRTRRARAASTALGGFTSKRRSFEEILDSEFRWSTQGDKAFVASANSSENANIDESGHSRLVLMTDGYKKAGDLMVEAA